MKITTKNPITERRSIADIKNGLIFKLNEFTYIVTGEALDERYNKYFCLELGTLISLRNDNLITEVFAVDEIIMRRCSSEGDN